MKNIFLSMRGDKITSRSEMRDLNRSKINFMGKKSWFEPNIDFE